MMELLLEKIFKKVKMYQAAKSHSICPKCELALKGKKGFESDDKTTIRSDVKNCAFLELAQRCS